MLGHKARCKAALVRRCKSHHLRDGENGLSAVRQGRCVASREALAFQGYSKPRRFRLPPSPRTTFSWRGLDDAWKPEPFLSRGILRPGDALGAGDLNAHANYHGSLRGQPSSIRCLGHRSGRKAGNELTTRGFTAVALGENGAPNKMIKTFDPLVDRTLFIPQLQGG